MERVEECRRVGEHWELVLSCGHTLMLSAMPTTAFVACPKCKKVT